MISSAITSKRYSTGTKETSRRPPTLQLRTGARSGNYFANMVWRCTGSVFRAPKGMLGQQDEWLHTNLQQVKLASSYSGKGCKRTVPVCSASEEAKRGRFAYRPSSDQRSS